MVLKAKPALGGATSGEAVSDWKRIGIPILVALTAVIVAAWHYLKPAPPKHVVIATGPKQGVYYAMGKKYADYFARNGIELEVRETGGSVENFKLLTAPGSGVDCAIVQGGSSPADESRSRLEAVAGIYFEPVLVFYRGDTRLSQLSQLAGKKVALGVDGSGVRLIAQMLLDEAAPPGPPAPFTPINLGGNDAADALANGQIDAAFYVIAPDAPVVRRLLQTPGVHLMSFDHARAYSRRHPFLSATTLYQGVVDVQRNLPEADTQLVAAPATLVIRQNTHQAIIQLLVRAAQETNNGATLLSDPGAFPSDDRSELPFNKDAHYFLNNKPSIIDRTFPFWLASLIDRLILLVVPLLVVLLPLVQMLPPVLKWRVRRHLFKRYKRVRQIEAKLTANSSPAELQSGRDELVRMDQDLAAHKLPMEYVEELYNLRLHVSYVRDRLEAWLDAQAVPAAV